MKNRVVVTGMGVISPIGNSCNEFLESLKVGTNGISEINSFDTEKCVLMKISCYVFTFSHLALGTHCDMLLNFVHTQYLCRGS